MKTLYQIIAVYTILLIAVNANEQSSKILRDALFAEEAHQDYKTATEKYQSLLANFDKERQIAVTALYRLAEIHRKQGKTTEATTLYKRILTEFPSMETQVRLSKENLLTLGENVPEQPLTFSDEESKELARLKKLETTSPDIFKKSVHLENAAKNNHLHIIAYLIEKNADISYDNALYLASKNGHLTACKLILDTGYDPKGNRPAIQEAFAGGHSEVIKLLIKRGLNVQGHHGDWLPLLVKRDTPLSLIKLIIEAGYDINTISPNLSIPLLKKNPLISTSIRRPTPRTAQPTTQRVPKNIALRGGGLLHQALVIQHDDLLDYLFKKNANVNLASPKTGLTPLHIAANRGDQASVRRLIKAGVDVNYKLEKIWFNQATTALQLIILNLINYPNEPSQGHQDCIKLLLDSKATLPDTIIRDIIDRNQADLLEIFVQHGADPHVKDEYGYGYLSNALAKRHMECALYLINHGVTLHPDSFGHLSNSRMTPLTIDIRTIVMEKQLYPKFAKRKGITLVLPEMLWARQLLPASASTSEIASKIYHCGLPKSFSFFINEVREYRSIPLRDCDLVQCSLIRQGKRIPFKLTDGTWPEFVDGDIIELTQFKLSEERRKIVYSNKSQVSPTPAPSSQGSSLGEGAFLSPQIKKMLSKHLKPKTKPSSAPDKK